MREYTREDIAWSLCTDHISIKPVWGCAGCWAWRDPEGLTGRTNRQRRFESYVSLFGLPEYGPEGFQR